MDYRYLGNERKTLRMRWYNYDSAAQYFVTLCTYGRARLFGQIIKKKMVLTEAGYLSDFSNVSIPELIRNMKIFTTNSYIKGIHEKNWLPFKKRLWQRSYHEHVIRVADDVEIIRKYNRQSRKLERQ